jgi:SAM-dependent methyltransferase
MKVKKYRNCLIDKKSILKAVVDCGKLYPTGMFKKRKNIKITKVNLKLNFSQKFLFGQIENIVDPELMYDDYYYRSGTTTSMQKHFLYLINDIIKKNTTKRLRSILDIGTNDGTFLYLLKKSLRSTNNVGIDPSKAIYDTRKLKNHKNLKFIKDFFPSPRLTGEQKYDLISCISVFYDFLDPVKCLKSIANLLSDDGIFICEVNYFKDLLEKCNFDMISHEHLCYYSATSFYKACNLSGLKLINVYKNQMNGGNIVLVCKKNKQKISRSVEKILAEEALFFRSNWKKKFLYLIKKSKKEILNHLKKLKSENKKIAIYGASTRGDTMIQMFKEIENYIEFAIDKMPSKHGMYMPGTKIKIYHEDKIPFKVNAYFVLPYQYFEEFIEKEKVFLNTGGELFTYRPNFRVVKI